MLLVEARVSDGLNTYTQRYQQILDIIIKMIRIPNHTLTITNHHLFSYSQYLISIGLFEVVDPLRNLIRLNMDKLPELSSVVPDNIYEKLRDKDWVQRKELELIGYDEDEIEEILYKKQVGSRARRNRRIRTKKERMLKKEQARDKVWEQYLDEDLPLRDILL